MSARFLALWASFPCLEDAVYPEGERIGQALVPSIENINTLDLWASKYAGSGAKQVVAFVLMVYSRRVAWRTPPFDLLEAMSVWDEHNRKAFAAWVERPFRA